MNVVHIIHDALVQGALSKGGSWGGPVCRTAVDMKTHLVESIFWICLSIVIFVAYSMKAKIAALCKNISEDLAKSKDSPTIRTMEMCLATVHFLLYAQVVYYKSNIWSLINLIQPCHVIVLSQGIALYGNNLATVLISIFMLPALTGTLLAMLFPDTSGLDQPFEMEGYWIQHYLVQIVPLYLLVRKNFLALKYANFFSTVVGIWILMFLHFSLYEVVDVLLNVNVEFMLCPTDAMVTIFANLPAWIIWPSYRSVLTVAVALVAVPISYSYILGGRALRRIAAGAGAGAGGSDMKKKAK